MGGKGLFDELHIGGLVARNRLVRAATYERASDAHGMVTPEIMRIYRELAVGGVGTIISSFAYVREDEYRRDRMLGLDRDEVLPGYRELVEAVHATGTRFVAQIVHCGATAGKPPFTDSAWAPSDGVSPVDETRSVRAMTHTDMGALAADFAAAARRAQQAGFDGVEVHAAHGYLLSQFLNPLWNHREDEYGGSIEGRMRFPVQVLRAVRDAVGPDFPILVKINSSDGVPGGMTEDESLVVSQAFAKVVDAIEVSGTTYGKVRIAGPDGQHCLYAPYAARLAELVDIPVILTGGNRLAPELQELLDTTGISGFGLARPLVCEPDLPARWQRDAAYVPRCVSCSRCFPEAGRNCVLHSTR